MIDWNTFIATILSNTVLLAILAFVAKSLFGQLLSRDLETYKKNAEKEIEEFKASLQQAAIERQTRFQSLHAKRSEIIAELYTLIVQAKEDADSLVSIFQFANEPPLIEKAKKAIESSNNLHRYFEKNRIFLKPDVCVRIEKFSLDLRKNINSFSMQLPNTDIDQWQVILRSMDEELPQLKTDIEKYFRETFDG